MAYNAADDIEAFVNEHWIPAKVADQIGENSTLMKLLLSSGRTDTGGNPKPMTKDEMIVGGKQVKRSLRFARSAARGSMSGYDVLNVDPNRKYEYALFDWQTYYASLPWSLDEVLAARGKEAVLNKLDDDLDGLVADVSDMVASGIYNSAATRILPYQDKGFHGLRELCKTDRSWGNIDSTTYAWFDPGHYDAAAYTEATLSDPADADAILNLVRTGINNCSHAGKRPTHIFTTSAIFDLIEDTMKFQKIYQGTSKRSSIGYQYLDYRGVEIVADPHYCPDYHMFFLTVNGKGKKRTIGIKGRQDAWFKLTKWREPVNQLTKVRVLYTQGSMYCDTPRMQGMYTDLAQT